MKILKNDVIKCLSPHKFGAFEGFKPDLLSEF